MPTTRPPTIRPLAAVMAASSPAMAPPKTAGTGSSPTTSAARARGPSQRCCFQRTTEAVERLQGLHAGGSSHYWPHPPPQQHSTPSSPRRSGGPHPWPPRPARVDRRATRAALAQGRSLEGTVAQQNLRAWKGSLQHGFANQDLPGPLKRLLANRSSPSRRPAIPGCGSVLLELKTPHAR